MTVIRVLTWNIHKGFGHNRRLLTVRTIREALIEEDCDIVMLQEVVGRHDHHAARFDDWPAAPQAEFLAGETWGQWAYGANAWYPHGHHGNAVLSRFPIIGWRNTDLSNHRWEQRGVLHTRVQIPGLPHPLHVLCTHLDLLHRGRIRQVVRIANQIRSEIPNDEPLVLAGDFNDWSRRLGASLETDLGLVEAHRAIHGCLARSFPARLPLLTLDRLYVRGITVRNSQILRSGRYKKLSDHAPLMTELEIVP
jgi:endonuclease/exonuclease/phosphatase family metal-dependent hydrolase